jgi:hypothetical protein
MDDPLAWAAAQHATDPVQQRTLLALARRAAAQPPGALRERLVAKLQQRAQRSASTLMPSRAADTGPSPLAVLLAQLQAGAGPELRQVQAHQRTWSQLRVARRMAEVAAPVPEHLGPLNNQVLATRALQQLQALAPGYLQRLLTQLDALAALAPLQPAAAPAERAARKAAAPRRR